MTVDVRLPRIACALAKALADHALKLRELPRSRQRMLTYSELQKKSGASFALVGIGHHLDRIMQGLRDHDLPYGLTLLVWSKDGKIDYTAGEWYDITPQNALEFRKEVVAYDWNRVTFLES